MTFPHVLVAEGHPCTVPYRELDVGPLSSKPSGAREGMPA